MPLNLESNIVIPPSLFAIPSTHQSEYQLPTPILSDASPVIDPYKHSIPMDLWLYSEDESFDRATEALMPLVGSVGRPKLVRSNLRQLLICLAHAYHKSPSLYLGFARRECEWTRSTEIPPDVSFKMIAVIDALVSEGLIDHVKGQYFRYAEDGREGMRSRMRATQVLVDDYFVSYGLMNTHVICHPEYPLIVLRDSNKRGITFDETDHTWQMRATLERYRTFMADHELGSANPRVDEIINGGRKYLHRVFNDGVFTKGGRFYGHCVQNLKKKDRRAVLIDAAPVIELDYRGNHLSFLYAQHGICYSRDIGGDPYDLGDTNWPRPLVKQAMLILMNEGNITSSWRAVLNKLDNKKYAEMIRARSQFEELLTAIIRKHPIFAQYCSHDPEHEGLAGALQYEDSCVAEQVMLSLMDQGIPVIPVHDSFLVNTHHEQSLRRSMTEAYSTLGWDLALPEIRVVDA